MYQFGGKPTKSSSDSKRHFTVVIGSKEHGLYVSSTPSSAARKAVTKLCASNKGKKVEFHIREITQGSKKKTYGPYMGYIEKLKEPIELKGRVIKYKPVAKLIGKTGKKMVGGGIRLVVNCDNIQVYEKAIKLIKDTSGISISEPNKNKNRFYIDIVYNKNINGSKLEYAHERSTHLENLLKLIVGITIEREYPRNTQSLILRKPFGNGENNGLFN